MGLLQAAYRTYETQAHLAGIPVENQDTLTPVSHMVQNAHIEITLSDSGAFQSARPLAKGEAKTIIPVTEESANRVGDNDRAHPLCDQLRYLAPFGGSKYEAYLAQLTAWAESDCSHSKVRAVLHYIQSHALLSDLAAAGLLTLNEGGIPAGGKIEGTEYAKCLVRWRIVPPPADASSACWEDVSLFDAFIRYYAKRRGDAARDLCTISGEQDFPAALHPKGVLAGNFGAKLVSANDSSGFTFRGRFHYPMEAVTIGYTASQKAHSALRWLAANHGVIMGGRTFLWWMPSGKALPVFDTFGMSPSKEPVNFPNYQKQLLYTLGGYRQALSGDDEVVVTALDAATTGRLSATYYSEMPAKDFFDRLQNWYQTCCWDCRYYGVQSPSLRRIAKCAFGTQRGNFIEADDKVLCEHVQQLLHCVVDQAPIPEDIVRALAVRASQPQAYNPANRETLLTAACAVIRKYRNDKLQKEEWTLALDENNTNRSYLYGRLLAIAEQVERITYSAQEERETNAMRMQTRFAQQPFTTWRTLESDKLSPYYQRLTPKKRKDFKDLIGSIVETFSPDDFTLNTRLDDVYLLGYYHQRTALTTKKEQPSKESADTNVKLEETENEHTES